MRYTPRTKKAKVGDPESANGHADSATGVQVLSPQRQVISPRPTADSLHFPATSEPETTTASNGDNHSTVTSSIDEAEEPTMSVSMTIGLLVVITVVC